MVAGEIDQTKKLMSKDYNIEELLIKNLEGLEIEPSGNAWLRTQRMLRRKQFLRFNVRRFNVFYAVGLVGVGLAANTSVVIASILIFVLDFMAVIITDVFYEL